MSGMANYVSLDEAAKILGITTDELVEMRSRGEIFGYRDGASWKFKQEEIERVQSELDGDALNEDAGGSSILISGKSADGDEDDEIAISSDLKLATEGSDVALVADPESGSGVKLVKRNKQDAGNSDLKLDSETEGSDIALGSDLKLTDDASASGMDLLGRQPDSNVLGSDLGIKSGTGSNMGTPSVGSGSLDLGGDLELAKDDEDDLVLGLLFVPRFN
jgi:excisionase family DNA binding protein